MKLLKNLLLLAASIFLTFIASEVALRLFIPDKGSELIAISFSKDFVKKDNALGLSGIPFAEGTCYNCETKVGYKLNSQGFRDGEHQVEKDMGKRRIMVIGDSFVWGVGVGQDKIFTRLLGEKDKNFDVMNIAVPGWSTNNEYFYLEDRGLDYKPDMVFVVFCIENDAVGNGNYERGGFGDYGEHPLAEKKREGIFSIKYLRDHSRIYRLWKRKRRDLKIEWGLTPILTEYKEGSLEWKATTKWIDKFKELADANNFELVFVIAPSRNQFFLKKDPERPQMMLRNYLGGKGVKYLDLYPVFSYYKRAHSNNWGYFKYDGHWNELGHQIIAEEIYGFLS